MPPEIPYTPFIAVLLLASLSVLTTLAGIGLAIYASGRDRLIALGIGFSAGIMLLLSFLELMPEATGSAGAFAAGSAFVLGMITVAVLHWVIPHTHLVEETDPFVRIF